MLFRAGCGPLRYTLLHRLITSATLIGTAPIDMADDSSEPIPHAVTNRNFRIIGKNRLRRRFFSLDGRNSDLA